jgi:hypothetical protein
MHLEIYSLYLNELLRTSCPAPLGPAQLFKFVPDELVRRNLSAPGKLLLRCSTTYIPVGDIGRSPLIREPLGKSYGASASPEACRRKAQHEGKTQNTRFTRGASFGLSPWRGLHQSRRFRRRGRYMLQGSPSGASSAIRTRRFNFLPGRSMPAKLCLDSELSWKPEIPIGLAQRFLSCGYESAGDQPTLFAIFSLIFVPSCNMRAKC